MPVRPLEYYGVVALGPAQELGLAAVGQHRGQLIGQRAFVLHALGLDDVTSFGDSEGAFPLV